MNEKKPAEMGQQELLLHLVDRGVEGKLLPAEVDQLKTAIVALTADRRTPVTVEELSYALSECTPSYTNPEESILDHMAKELLTMAVITKIPGPIWEVENG